MIWKYKTMLIEPYIEKNYPKTSLLSGVSSIEEALINHRYFIVMGNHDDYLGMLTVPDVLLRKKKLVSSQV